MIKDLGTDIGTIAKRENLAEAHARFLAPLAYLSPRIIEAIAQGRAPVDVTVTGLVRNLLAVWVDRTSNSGSPDPTNGRPRPGSSFAYVTLKAALNGSTLALARALCP
jgi:hypothetical protein